MDTKESLGDKFNLSHCGFLIRLVNPNNQFKFMGRVYSLGERELAQNNERFSENEKEIVDYLIQMKYIFKIGKEPNIRYGITGLGVERYEQYKGEFTKACH